MCARRYCTGDMLRAAVAAGSEVGLVCTKLMRLSDWLTAWLRLSNWLTAWLRLSDWLTRLTAVV